MRLAALLLACALLSGCAVVALPFRVTGDVIGVVPVVGAAPAVRVGSAPLPSAAPAVHPAQASTSATAVSCRGPGTGTP